MSKFSEAHFGRSHIVTNSFSTCTGRKGLTLTEEARTHHGGLVLVDHHFFSFRNYAGARDKTKNSKAAGT